MRTERDKPTNFNKIVDFISIITTGFFVGLIIGQNIRQLVLYESIIIFIVCWGARILWGARIHENRTGQTHRLRQNK